LITHQISPVRLARNLTIYFVIVFGVAIGLLTTQPDLVDHLPIGGNDALGPSVIESLSDIVRAAQPPPREPVAVEDIGRTALFLTAHLAGALLAMIPIAMTYRAVNYDTGFSRNFVRALFILPICATTIVLLIQDSLALAFGLAALVAAVRFRVALDEATDGIFIFAAICVGLAAGIGYLGIALIMSVFFCYVNLILWTVDYGKNPADDARLAKKRAKLERSG